MIRVGIKKCIVWTTWFIMRTKVNSYKIIISLVIHNHNVSKKPRRQKEFQSEGETTGVFYCTSCRNFLVFLGIFGYYWAFLGIIWYSRIFSGIFGYFLGISWVFLGIFRHLWVFPRAYSSEQLRFPAHFQI